MSGKQTITVRGPWALLWFRFRKNRVAMVGGSILIVLYGLACFAGFLSPYDYREIETRATFYGPMLFGGYHAEFVGSHPDPYGRFEELNEYERTWRWFDGGLHFRGLRPHVHPLREVASYDVHGEIDRFLITDTRESLPLRFFVRSEDEHEVFSLCGFVPIRGHLRLFDVVDPYDRDSPNLGRVHLLGSDATGRDLLTRILFGGQISLSVGLIGIFLTMSLALIIGGIAGYFGGHVDFLLMRFVELLMAIPSLYLILTLRATFPANLTSRQTYLMIVAVLALAGWASTGRVIRGMVLAIKEEDYVVAARGLGASTSRVIIKHVLPNTASFVIVTSSIFVPYYILGEVALSFLGLGITEPETSWGLLLRDAQNTQVLKFYPWLVIPGLFIFMAVLAYNFVGDGLRDAADPKAYLGTSGS